MEITLALDELDPYVPLARYRNRDSGGGLRDKQDLDSLIVMAST